MEPGRVLSARRTAAERLTPGEHLARATDPAWLRARLAAPEPADPLDPAAALRIAAAPAALIPAAVLVGITPLPSPGILLTRRGPTLRRHAGQVSFPGGRIDAGDASPEAAALREAQEEIGLDPADVEVVGRLGEVVTGTGFRITPVVGVVRAHEPKLSPIEVSAVFSLPLAVVLDPAAPERRGGFWVWPHPEHEIWGATAFILLQLARRIR